MALESTIYTHGIPHPQNAALAIDLENEVRANGAIPATIAILDGIARIGLGAEELVRLTEPVERGEKVMKVSRRDLPYILGQVCTISYLEALSFLPCIRL